MSLISPPKDSFAGKYLFPLAEYVTRIAELLVLTAIFYAAGEQTDSFFLTAMAVVLNMACGLYFGFVFAIPLSLAGRVKTKDWKVALAIALPGSVLMAWGAFELGQLMTEAVKALSTGSS